MAATTWPTADDFPQKPASTGYDEDPGNPFARTEMDVGPAKVRRRTSGSIEKFEVQYEVDGTHLSTWRTFYAAVGLSELFNWTHPSKGTSVEARFVSPPKIRNAGADNWVLVCSIEVLP